MMTLFHLFFEFFKVGLFAFGGGLSTLPFLTEMGTRTGWFTQAELADMLAVSESTPGPIGINMATYAGYTSAGIPGAVIAVLGIITPCVIVIIIIAGILEKFRSNPVVEAVFSGLRPASLGMVCAAGLEVIRITLFRFEVFQVSHSFWDLFSIKGIIMAVILFFAMKKIKLHPILFILISAVAGIALNLGGAY